MRITCLIDTLGSGGAQRQLVLLAGLLSEAGHDVNVLTYHPGDFFADHLRKRQVAHEEIQKGKKKRRLLSVIKKLHALRPDAVIAYGPGPSMLAELALLPKKTLLIVSERSLGGQSISTKERIRYRLHRRADYIVTNSRAQRLWIENRFPELRSKVVDIINCVDLKAFSPSTAAASLGGILHVVGVGRVDHGKSPHVLLQAVQQIRDKYPIHVNWYGRDGDGPYANELRVKIREMDAADWFVLCGPTQAVGDAYKRADMVCQPTRLEGCSNVICEAIATGRIVLTTPVGDNERLVLHKVNGWITPVDDVNALADALKTAAKLSPSDRRTMENASRTHAEHILSQETFLAAYEALLQMAPSS